MARLERGPKKRPRNLGKDCEAEGKENSANFANQQGQKNKLCAKHARAKGLPSFSNPCEDCEAEGKQRAAHLIRQPVVQEKQAVRQARPGEREMDTPNGSTPGNEPPLQEEMRTEPVRVCEILSDYGCTIALICCGVSGLTSTQLIGTTPH